MSVVGVHEYLRTLMTQKDATERIGPFTVGYSLRSEMPYLNYAVPDDEAGPTMGEVQALVAAFAAQGRRARLEYIPTLAPALEEVLTVCGFAEEGRYPLMTASLSDSASSTSGEWEAFAPLTDGEVEAYVSAVHQAFGGVASPRDFAAFRDRLGRGTHAVGLRTADGQVVGGGELTPVIGGVAELAGVGVLPSFRGQGAGTRIVQELMALAPSVGAHTLFLMAAGEAEQRMYARAGFVTGGEVLHISVPAL